MSSENVKVLFAKRLKLYRALYTLALLTIAGLGFTIIGKKNILGDNTKNIVFSVGALSMLASGVGAFLYRCPACNKNLAVAVPNPLVNVPKHCPSCQVELQD